MALKGADQAMNVLREFVNTTIPKKVEATAKQIATYGLNYALSISPIETGRYMASWRVSVGQPALDYSPRGEIYDAVSAGDSARSTSAAAISQIKIGTRFYISNAIPYATYVEYGSPKSPARYVARRVTQAIGGRFGKI